MAMDNKTVYGFILIAMGIAAQIVAKYIGVDGEIMAGSQAIVAAGLLLIAGIQYQQNKNTGGGTQ